MNLDYSEKEPLIHREENSRQNENQSSPKNLNEIVEESKDQLFKNGPNHSLKYSTFADNNNTNAPLVDFSPSSSSSLFFRNIQINNNETSNQHLNHVL